MLMKVVFYAEGLEDYSSAVLKNNILLDACFRKKLNHCVPQWQTTKTRLTSSTEKKGQNVQEIKNKFPINQAKHNSLQFFRYSCLAWPKRVKRHEYFFFKVKTVCFCVLG